MNESFGARLRRQRERQHITLGQIAASTKIQASLFEGLERNDVSRWPGGIFGRSFIRAYAEAIGLNPDQICREFLERFPESFPDGLALAVSQGGVLVPARPPVPVQPALNSSRIVFGQVPEAPLLHPSAKPDTDDGEEPRLLLAETPGSEAPSSHEAMLVVAERFGAGHAAAKEPIPTRWLAAAIDASSTLLLALLGYTVFGTFWAPLAVISLLYNVVATLALGRTPGFALIAGVAPSGRSMARSADRQQPAPALDRVHVGSVESTASISDVREAREPREAVNALEVLTIESLPQPAMQVAEADVAPSAGPAAYSALHSPFDLERRRRARA
ncbi:MAG: helix-turn-helix domain-containing protein [Acidimicrobiia bacterium]|nr:helix-turn-helix domain-containing protein [Acidimicrobiia bacterium]